MAEEFSREVDFFSIGTNDLIQYTLAVDRANQAVANLFSSGDPSILKLINMVLVAARNHKIPVTVCGQMSSDPMYTPLLVGMGLRQLSISPHMLPEIKGVVPKSHFCSGPEYCPARSKPGSCARRGELSPRRAQKAVSGSGFMKRSRKS